MSNQQSVVLAFSGGLDTSYCVLALRQQGFDVHTAFVDTGGIDEERLRVVPREDLGPDRTDEPAPIAAFDLAPGD